MTIQRSSSWAINTKSPSECSHLLIGEVGEGDGVGEDGLADLNVNGNND